MLNIVQFTFNLFRERAALAFREPGRCVAVDPGFCGREEEEEFLSALRKYALRPETVLLTHAHPDHIYGVKRLQELYGTPVYMHPAEKPVLKYGREMASMFSVSEPDCGFCTVDIGDGDRIDAAGIRFEVIATPGHTPGGVCFLDREDGVLFSGDTLFAGAIGRTDFKYGEYDDEIRSIMEKLIVLDPGTRICPGHGPDSTIGHERNCNPFLEPFNEAEETDSDPAPVIISGS